MEFFPTAGGFTELCKGKVEEIADVELDYARYLFAKNVK